MFKAYQNYWLRNHIKILIQLKYIKHSNLCVFKSMLSLPKRFNQICLYKNRIEIMLNCRTDKIFEIKINYFWRRIKKEKSLIKIHINFPWTQFPLKNKTDNLFLSIFPLIFFFLCLYETFSYQKEWKTFSLLFIYNLVCWSIA